MNITGNFKDKHFIHIQDVLFGQVFITKDNVVYMKVRVCKTKNRFIDEEYKELLQSMEDLAVNLKDGTLKQIHPEANLRLLNCSLKIDAIMPLAHTN